MQTRPRERARGAFVVDDDPQRRPRLLGNATGVGDVARIDRERPGEVLEPGAREHLRLDQRRHGEPTRAPRELERSEEHTSELQSRFDLVCRLLLEIINHTYSHRMSTPCFCFSAPTL